MSEKINFQAEVNKMLGIVINSLYSEKYIFLRELISNASDACDKLKYLQLTKPDAAKGNGELKITITPDEKENTLTIADNGIGMNRDDLINHLGTIAKSGTADFVANMKENGSPEIKLFLKDDDKNFTDTIYLRHLIRTYSDHINYPIVLNLGEAGEETVNSASALWTRNKAEITEEQYKDFYRHISHNFDDPWLTLHFKAEGSIEYTGLLYIPSTQPYDLFQPDRKQGLKLYVNRVFISDKVEELMPSYLRFVKGIVDSSDLPLNISREMLQQNALVAKIRHGIVGRLLKELKKKSENYEDYLKFWQAFGVAFKEGIYEDFANREEVASLSLFHSTADAEKMTTLDQYVSRMKEDQKAIYYITGDDVRVLANNPQLEAFRQKGIEVLLLTDPIDEFWTQTLVNYKGKAVKHVSQAEADLSFERRERRAEAGSLEKLTALMTELFKDEVGKVKVTEKLTTSPVSLTVENGQMSIHLERLMRNHQQQTAFASTRILEINPYHPLIVKLSEAMGDEALRLKVEEVAKVLLDQAKIAEGEPISDPSFYAAKISEYILKSF